MNIKSFWFSAPRQVQMAEITTPVTVGPPLFSVFHFLSEFIPCNIVCLGFPLSTSPPVFPDDHSYWRVFSEHVPYPLPYCLFLIVCVWDLSSPVRPIISSTCYMLHPADFLHFSSWSHFESMLSFYILYLLIYVSYPYSSAIHIILFIILVFG